MSTTFFTSDLHLTHEFVAKQRGANDSIHHDSMLVTRWNSRVTKRDTVWVLGDLSMGSLSTTLEIMSFLNGRKHLVFGNHDAGHPMHRGAQSKQKRYLEVFESVQSAAQIRIDGQKVMLSHFPYVGDHADREDRHTEWRLRDEGLPLLCGHVHDEWVQSGRQFNVGVDHSPGLVSLSGVTEWLRTL